MSPVLGLLLCHTCILCICSCICVCICINICICNSGPCRGWTLVHRVSSLCLRFLISFLYHLCFMIWVLHVRLCSLKTVEDSQNVQSQHLLALSANFVFYPFHLKIRLFNAMHKKLILCQCLVTWHQRQRAVEVCVDWPRRNCTF